KEDAYQFLESVGIDKETSNRSVNQLSGGEQQRVAIARALSTDISILMADEPTGNLDKETGKTIVDIFKRLAHEENKCIIVVTHSDLIANQSDVVLKLDTDIKGFREIINESV
ncbi:MAG: ATP-binding cassette domain-containing protein, partial [Traorella sp.]